MVIPNFPEIGKISPSYRAFNFCAPRGFSSDIPLPRLVIDHPMVFSRGLPLKSQISPGGGKPVRGANY